MKLHLLREPTLDDRTFGALYIDGVWHCWTLEDAMRQPMRLLHAATTDLNAWVHEWKVPGHTAIPFGTYDVVLTPSMRFQRVMPEVLGVPGFSGIRIHAGNTIDETEGCPLVGLDRTSARMLRSLVAFTTLFDRLSTAVGAHDRVTLTILPPVSWEGVPWLAPATTARPVTV